MPFDFVVLRFSEVFASSVVGDRVLAPSDRPARLIARALWSS